MDDATRDDLVQELARLKEAEARLTAERDRLQHQIDFGFATQTTPEREREISDERRKVHANIDALQRRLDEQHVA